MTYPDNIEHKIDFPVIRERLNGLCTSSLGREWVSKMHFMTDADAIRYLLSETEQMKSVLRDASLEFPRGEIHDICEAIKRIQIDGLFLDENELHLLRQSLSYAGALEQFFLHLDEERFPALVKLPHHNPEAALSVTYRPLSDIVAAIERILDPFGRLRDNASPELARIRGDLSRAQGSVSRAIHSILRQAQAEGILDKDVAPTMREGRLVLPIPPAVRRKFNGIVHDESATGKTLFIEPAAVVEANNHIRALEAEEHRERVRILMEVTAALRPSIPDILSVESFLGYVDFVRAKALLAITLNALAPEIHNAPILDWRTVRHAVLLLRFIQENRQVVPMSLSLNTAEHTSRILVISGPNAGGKSVCLKTVALTQYMLQCGLLVPMDESSRAGVFEHLMIDIGDEQSITDDLSTYSSHLRNMKFFLRHADPRTLFLIDEFGSGTEPLIGGAIAEAILSTLNDRQAIGLVTTHYANLKHLAEQTQGMMNGAMLYDRGALRPLFELSVGQAGSSFAIEIARQIGLPEQIIADARQLVGSDHIDYDRQLQDIARDRRYWEHKRQNIRLREKHLEERIAHYEKEIAGLKAKRKEIIAYAETQAAELLRQSNATIERTIREIKEAKADKEKTKRARAKVENLKQKVSTKTLPEPIKKEAGEVSGGKKPRLLRDFRDLKAVTQSLPSTQPNIANTIRKAKLSFNRELDLRGMRADEALEQLIAYMDNAIMVAAGTVTILHGTGTGALKQLTRDYLAPLKRRNRIIDFHDGDPDRGGAGLTIVEI